MRQILRLVAVVAFLAARSGLAVTPDEAKQKARAEYTEAMKNYNLAEYQQALEHFKEAYRAFPDASFLFNIGQCQRSLGQKADAVRSYRAYLRDAKTGRAEVEQIIAGLEKAIAEENAAKNKTPIGVMGPDISTSTQPQPQPTPKPVEPKPVVAAPTPAPQPKPVEPKPVVAATVEPKPTPTPQPKPVEPKPAPTVVESKPAPKPVEPKPAPVVAESKPETAVTSTPPEKKPIYKKGWFWGVVVGVVVVVGAGVGVGVALSGSKTTFPASNASGGTFRF